MEMGKTVGRGHLGTHYILGEQGEILGVLNIRHGSHYGFNIRSDRFGAYQFLKMGLCKTNRAFIFLSKISSQKRMKVGNLERQEREGKSNSVPCKEKAYDCQISGCN